MVGDAGWLHWLLASAKAGEAEAGQRRGSAGWLERGKGEGDDRWGPLVGVTERVKG